MVYFFQSLSLKVRFLTLLLLLFPVLVFQWLLTQAPWSLASLRLLSHGVGVPDERFWYDPAALQAVFQAWGTAGKIHYWSVLWPTDLGFILAYGLFLTAATLYLLKKTNPAGPWWYGLPLLPLASAGFDLLENVVVATASLLPAEGWEPVSWMAAGLTAAKWSLLGLTGLVLLLGTAVGLLRAGWHKVRSWIDSPTSETPGDRTE